MTSVHDTMRGGMAGDPNLAYYSNQPVTFNWCGFPRCHISGNWSPSDLNSIGLTVPSR